MELCNKIMTMSLKACVPSHVKTWMGERHWSSEWKWYSYLWNGYDMHWSRTLTTFFILAYMFHCGQHQRPAVASGAAYWAGEGLGIIEFILSLFMPVKWTNYFHHFGSDLSLYPQFETGPLGCILLTISAVLSRSIEKYVMPLQAL